MQRLTLAALLVLALFVGGCERRAKRGQVRGDVTLNGAPLKSGLIRFEPIGGKTTNAGGLIQKGKYDTLVQPGKYRVEITAQYMVTPPGTPADRVVVANHVPEKYNRKSELTVDVVLGVNEKSFDLKSEKK